jgi:teichuronopeptide biosynthesis TupA-like protein
MQWLKLFDQSHQIVRCANKITFRDFVRERLGDGYQVEAYQVCDYFSQIDFDTLPTAFVIKANHDSGTVKLVRDKNKLNKEEAREHIERALAVTFGREMGEWAYAYIRPRILVEEFIEPEAPAPPSDYKFYCVEGKVRFMEFIYDRGSNTKELIVDLNGKVTGILLYEEFELGREFTKPAEWQEMISVAEKLSRGFKFVRVDLYLTKGRILVGEMTFWPMGGTYLGDGQRRLGQFLDFDRTTFKAPIIPELERSGLQ